MDEPGTWASTGPGNGAVTGGLPARPARRLTLMLNVQDHRHHASLMVELVRRARRAGMAGLTVFEGHAGFGASGAAHRTRLLHDDAPLAVVIVDEPDRIDHFLAAAADVLGPVLAVIDDVTVVRT